MKNNEIIDAEYRVVPERTLEVIATEIRTIDNHIYQVALNGAIEIGRRLEEAKEKVEHGNWEQWCRDNLNYTPSWASKLMKISSEYGKENSAYLAALAKTDTCADLGISKALRLLQVPEDEVETFVEEHDIAADTVKELEAKIKALEAEKDNYKNTEETLAMTSAKLAAAEQAKADAVTARLSIEEKLKEMENRSEEEKSSGDIPEEVHREIEKLKADLAKAVEDAEKKKAAEQKLKDKLKNAEADNAKAIEEAKAKAIEEGKKSAEEKLKADMEKAEAEKQAALEAVAAAEKRAENLSNEDTVSFKLYADEMQVTFNKMFEIIERKRGDDEEKANKWSEVLCSIMNAQLSRLEV